MPFKINQAHQLHLLQRLVLILGLTLLSSACGISLFGSTEEGLEYGMQKSSDPFALMEVAERFEKNGQSSAAISLYRRLISTKPFDYRPRYGLGRSLMSLGEYEEALRVLLKAKTLNQNDPSLTTSTGLIYLIFGEVDISRQYFTSAIDAGYAPANAYSGLSLTYDLAGQHKQSLEIFEKGLMLYPDNLGLLNNLALSQALAGNSAQAVEAFISLASRPNADSQVRRNLALSLALTGDMDRAWNVLTLDLDSESADQVLGSFLTLGSIAQPQRFKAVIYGMVANRHDLEQAANPSEQKPSLVPKKVMERALEPTVPHVMQIVAKISFRESNPEVPSLLDPEGWAVQIAAYRNIEDLASGWVLLRDRYPDILGSLEPRRSEVNFGDRSPGPAGFYYRLNAGPLSGIDQAQTICHRLNELNQECWIRPPEPSEGHLIISESDSGSTSSP